MCLSLYLQIHRSFVLTAAHCLYSYPADVWTVTIGDQNSKRREEHEQNIPAAETILHPNYTFPQFVHDIALIRLARPVVWGAYAQPACLPEPDGRTPRGKGFLAGWGFDGESKKGGHPTESLHLAQLPVMENAQCEDWFRSQGKKISLQPVHLCAGHEAGQEDGCQGDSGGGLVFKDDKSSQLVVVGVMSAGIGCGREKLPGVYTRVDKFIDWIEDHVSKSLFDQGRERRSLLDQGRETRVPFYLNRRSPLVQERERRGLSEQERGSLYSGRRRSLFNRDSERKRLFNQDSGSFYNHLVGTRGRSLVHPERRTLSDRDRRSPYNQDRRRRRNFYGQQERERSLFNQDRSSFRGAKRRGVRSLRKQQQDVINNNRRVLRHQGRSNNSPPKDYMIRM